MREGDPSARVPGPSPAAIARPSVNRGQSPGLLTLEEVIPGCLDDLQLAGVIRVLGLGISCREETVRRGPFSYLGLGRYARCIFQSHDPNSLFLNSSQHPKPHGIGTLHKQGTLCSQACLARGFCSLLPLPLDPSPSDVKGWARRSALCPAGYGQSS